MARTRWPSQFHINYTLLQLSYGQLFALFPVEGELFFMQQDQFHKPEIHLVRIIADLPRIYGFMLNCRANLEVINFKDIYQY